MNTMNWTTCLYNFIASNEFVTSLNWFYQPTFTFIEWPRRSQKEYCVEKFCKTNHSVICLLKKLKGKNNNICLL